MLIMAFHIWICMILTKINSTIYRNYEFLGLSKKIYTKLTSVIFDSCSSALISLAYFVKLSCILGGEILKFRDHMHIIAH